MKPKRYPYIKPIAYYLPQFHPVPENNEWWGTGFTEWRSCTTARPLFPGHHQPKIPGDLGYYDLRLPEVQREQAKLARAHGIHGFCHYFYWFDGRQILERPTELLLANKDIDIGFCLCWANENWTRRWDGQDQEVLLLQRYDTSTFPSFAKTLLKFFEDDRYIKIDGRPLFIIYSPAHVSEIQLLTDTLRKEAKNRGFPDLHIIGAETFVNYGEWEDPRKHGLDGAVEFPPHGTSSDMIYPTHLAAEKFEGCLFDQFSTFVNSAMRPDPDFPLYRCLFPAWDNTPRRDTRASIYVGASPDLFAHWLDHHCQWTERVHARDEQLLFINAWNEWAEGAYLEPDILNGSAFLEALRQTLDGERLLEFPISSAQIARLAPRERHHFAAQYIHQARPTLGYRVQLQKRPNPKFRVPHRLYDHQRRQPFPISISGDQLSVSTFTRIRSLLRPRTFEQLKREFVMLFKVDCPTTIGERIRSATYYAVRNAYRTLRSPQRVLRNRTSRNL